MRAAGVKKRITAADAEFFQRFETIRRKAGRGDGEALDALRRISGERRVGRGLEPLRAPEARLEGDFDRAAERLAEQTRGLLAMAVVRITELESPLGHPVKA